MLTFKLVKPARLFIVLLIYILTSLSLFSQKTANVHAKFTYVLSENDNVTIKEAKIKAIELAKAEALKNEFGMLVVSDYINTEKVANDEFSSYFMADTQASIKGEWLGDEREPEITIECIDGDIFFTAEVWGKAREIVRAHTDLKWEVQKDNNGARIESDKFKSGERFFIKFKSPADGYIAIYLITGDSETACLLPYRKDNSGRFQIKGGKEYTFFDKSVDPTASYYKLSTDQPQELNQLVIIYSPNPFTKCTDVGGDARNPNSVNQKDFVKWLLRNQRADNEMVVARKWLTIEGME